MDTITEITPGARERMEGMQASNAYAAIAHDLLAQAFDLPQEPHLVLAEAQVWATLALALETRFTD